MADEVSVSLEQALAIGFDHHRAGRLEEAQAVYLQILEVLPDEPNANDLLGLVLQTRGDLVGAHAALMKAIAAAPGNARYHADLGSVFLQAGQADDAIQAFRTAIAHDPAPALYHFNLGLAHQLAGDLPAARAAHAAARERAPDMPEALLAAAISQLPIIAASEAEAVASRAAYQVGLAALAVLPPAEVASAIGSQQPFYLPYQGQNDRALQIAFGEICATAMATTVPPFAAPAVARGLLPRVAIVGAHLRRHSVWNAITRGWVAELPARGIDLHLFGTSTVVDDDTRWAATRVAGIDLVGRTPQDWIATIRASQPDIVVFPEIGIDPMALVLASVRLAPVQAVAWGHPQTSGLPTVDYYLSAAAFEPADGDDHYSEQLARLSGLGVFLEPPPLREPPASRSRYGLPERGVLIACPGSLFKYRPARDPLLVEIAAANPAARLVFFSHRSAPVVAAFRARLTAAFAASGLRFEDHVTILPRLSLDEFRAVLSAADLALDSPDFSGFNTAIEVLVAGLPLVTAPGAFLRGRFGAGVLGAIGLGDLVAPDLAGTVDLASALIRDPGLRRDHAQRIAAALPGVAADHQAIDSMLAWARGAA